MKLTAAWAKRLGELGHRVKVTGSKMGNVRTASGDNIVHASKREASRWDELRLMERGGVIRNLKRQIPFDLTVKGIHIATYVADHVYEECQRDGLWLPIVEDAKGFRTRVYTMKRALMLACYGVKLREV